jgi:hypothetical protein
MTLKISRPARLHINVHAKSRCDNQHQMITGMENQLERYKEKLRRLQSIPGSFWTDST